ncbi:MAG: hypothetical protein GYA55_08305 [SAR324 cluster bacterium]|uniref:FAS1 domain-containing protein n=1 Tax=SAR324 cluster bacterium TaxID=2024889 RepID=A0A7X9FS09_9DELT|nr:hypothetical protein [SAR324 cluster bacterium]
MVPTDELKKVLTYHVVAGEIPASKVVKMDSANTVEGSSLRIHVEGSKVLIDSATVSKADIKTSNGLIHVIDTVLQPSN